MLRVFTSALVTVVVGWLFGTSVVGAQAQPQEELKQAVSSSDSKTVEIFRGRATWYGEELHGRRTASGRPFDMNKLTAAHPVLPFGTKVLVTNQRTGLSCMVEINDRCPPRSNRVIDVSKEAARKLGILPGGHAHVECIIVAANTSP